MNFTLYASPELAERAFVFKRLPLEQRCVFFFGGGVLKAVYSDTSANE